MTDHDPYCQWPRIPCQCADFAAARADEQDEMLLRGWAPVEEHETLFAASVAALLVKAICDQEQRRVDLRAKVLEVPLYGGMLRREVVLALIDGSSDE